MDSSMMTNNTVCKSVLAFLSLESDNDCAMIIVTH